MAPIHGAVYTNGSGPFSCNDRNSNGAVPYTSVEANNGARNGQVSKKQEVRRSATSRAEGPACILGIGTANPKTEYKQSEYTDWYFNATNSNHETELKDRFRRICENSGIEKKYLHMNDEVIAQHPNFGEYSSVSIKERAAMGLDASPKLGAEAAEKALAEWARPRSEITHLVYTSSSGLHLPGLDFTVSQLLGLRPDVKRCMMYYQGCFAGGCALRVAKDMAENNKGARVLVIASEMTVDTWRGPTHNNVSHLVGMAIFADGAAAVIVGSDSIAEIEKPIFEIQWSGETFIPDSSTDVEAWPTEAGIYFSLSKRLPKFIAERSSSIIHEALAHAGAPNLNDIFWVVHSAGRAVLDELAKQYDLGPKKLIAARETLRDHGNMFGASVFFAMDHMRKRSKEMGASTTGEGSEWGLCMAMGPGITVEISLLKAVSLESP